MTDALLRGDMTEEELSKVAEEVLKSTVPSTAAMLLTDFKRRAPKYLRHERKTTAGFVARNYRRWRKPLDLLELLWVISEEAGRTLNDAERPAAARDKDYQFDALTTLHARALLVTREILCLLYGGFPDGALSRWRSLHELTVTALFLSVHDQDVSHRYLASFEFAAYRAAVQLNQHAARAKMDPFTDEEVLQMKRCCEAFATRFDQDMYNEYGWAARALNNPKPNFAQLEKMVQLDHWRPRYRWASQHTHSGHRPPQALLGASEAVQMVHLVGPSNSGFVDPLHMTAISLAQATSALLVTRPTLDHTILMKVMLDLGDEIGQLALRVEKETLMKAREKEAQKRSKS